MKERVGSMVGQAVEGMPWLGTFHSIGAKILRRHAELVGLKPDFTILDTDDQIRLIKQLLEAENIDEKRWPARVLAGADRRLEEPRADARPGAGRRSRAPSPTAAAEALRRLPGAAEDAERRRFRRPAAGDASGCSARTRTCWRSISAASSTSWSTSTRTPTSRSISGCGCWRSGGGAHLSPERRRRAPRGERAPTVTSPPKNICCVGDDDQSIYGWRGAEVDNILRFEQDFPGAKVIRLERNYRSTGHILAAASHLIAHNEGRLGKTLRTEDVPGEKVTVTGAWDSEEEARTIGEEIEQLQRARPRARRDRHPGARLVPDARVRGPLRHARPALPRDRRPALLRARRRSATRWPICASIHSPADDLAFERIVNVPQARPRRRHAAAPARPRAQAPRPADRGRARARRDRRAEAQAARQRCAT